MPANKRRSRNGLSSSSSTAAAAASAQASLKSPNSLTKFFTNFNGFANGSYNGYHPTIPANHHQINSGTNSITPATATAARSNLPPRVVTVNGDSGSGNTNCTNIGGTIFTAKQQQQLDRNAFLLTLTKEQLKVECRKRGQKTNGTKTDLVLCWIPFFSL